MFVAEVHPFKMNMLGVLPSSRCQVHFQLVLGLLTFSFQTTLLSLEPQ